METKTVKFKKILKKIFSNEYSIIFMLLFGIGVCMFLYALIGNDFMLPINGDYVLQTYSFYSDGYNKIHEFLRTGDFPLFDYSNFLGASYIGTATFYYLFSPFFYLLLLWPRALLYQGIFFHMIFKFAVGGLLFYVLLRKYFKLKKFTSIIGAIIYSFSGWNLFYIWFHYSDVSALFPLILIGIERCLQDKKGGILTLSIFLMGITNYFFFFTFGLLGVLYALYRWIYLYGINKYMGHTAKERWSVLLNGVLHFLAGALLSAAVVLPSLVVALDSGRGDGSSLIKLLSFFFDNPQKLSSGYSLGSLKSIGEFFSFSNIKGLFKFIFVWEPRNYNNGQIVGATQSIGYVFTSFLFMNTDVWSTTVFYSPTLDNTMGGVFITTPIIMMLVPAIIKAFKTRRPWTIFGVIICFIMPLIPFSFHLFHGFTIMYGRWLLFIMSIALIFILCTFDNFEGINKKYILINFLINFSVGLFFVLYSYNNGTLTDQFKQYAIIFQFIYMIIVWLIIGFSYIKWEKVKKILFILVIGEVTMSAVITVEMKGYVDSDYYIGGPEKRKEQQEIIEDIKSLDKNDFYRIYNIMANRSNVNLPSNFSYNGMSIFNSIYNFEQKDFINRSRLAYSGGWSIGANEKRYYLDQYLGVKYYIVDKLDVNNDGYTNDVYDGKTSKEETSQKYRLNIPFGYELYKSYDYFDVYVNKNFTELGYSYNQYIPWDAVSYKNENAKPYHRYDASIYEELYSRMVIVNNEDLKDFENDNLIQRPNYSFLYKKYYSYEWNKKFSLREDCSIGKSSCYIQVPNDSNLSLKEYAKTMPRSVYDFGTNEITYSKLKELLPENSNFLHKRFEAFDFYGDQFIFELKPKSDGTKKYVCPLASNDNMCYLNISFKLGPKVLISLYNDDTLITQDAHMDYTTNSSAEYEWKYERGFYVNKPVNKIVIEFIQDAGLQTIFANYGNKRNEFMTPFNIYSQYENIINEYRNTLLEYPIENIVYKTNNFEFTTNYDVNRIVALTIPYDTGWSLKANGKALKVYNVNSGFIGFITPTGNVKYELSYHTPLLKEGFIISLIGGGLTLVLIAISFFGLQPQKPVFIDYDVDLIKKLKLQDKQNKKKETTKQKRKKPWKKKK